MKNKLIVYLLLFCSTQMLFSQTQKLSLLATDSLFVKMPNYVGFDNEGAYYFINNNILTKQSKTQTYHYQNIKNGAIKRISTFNPLMIVVFYEVFNTVVLLDNQLNEVREINFSTLQNPLVISAVDFSSQNRLWFYDTLSQKIGLININSLEVAFISNTLTSDIKNYGANYTHFFWIDNNNQLKRINCYGAVGYQNNFETELFFDTCFFSDDYKFFYTKNNTCYYYDMMTNTNFELNFDKKLVKNYFYKDGIFSIFTNNQITNFQIQK